MPSSLFGRTVTSETSSPTIGNGVSNQNGFQMLPAFEKVKSMMNLMSSSGNPSQMAQAMLQSNPQYASVMKTINENYGGDAKAAFYGEAKKKGIDPNSILNMLK